MTSSVLSHSTLPLSQHKYSLHSRIVSSSPPCRQYVEPDGSSRGCTRRRCGYQTLSCSARQAEFEDLRGPLRPSNRGYGCLASNNGALTPRFPCLDDIYASSIARVEWPSHLIAERIDYHQQNIQTTTGRRVHDQAPKVMTGMENPIALEWVVAGLNVRVVDISHQSLSYEIGDGSPP